MDYSTNITATIAPNIIDRQTSFNIDIGHWKLTKNIQLADPHFNEVSLFYELLFKRVAAEQTTRLRWVVSECCLRPSGTSLISSGVPLETP